jgi:hypothetical protein
LFIDNLAEMRKYAHDGDTGLGEENRNKGIGLEDNPFER